MTYSIHTFEMVKTFNTWNEYQSLFAFIKFDAKENGYNILYNEGPVNVPVSKFAGNGIRVLLHQDGYNSFVRFIINLHAVLHEYDDDGTGGGSTLPSVPDVQLDLDQYLAGVDDYVSTTEKFFQAVYNIIPKPIMDLIITSFGLLIVVGVIKIVFFMK